MNELKVVVFAGLPLSGKSTLARMLVDIRPNFVLLDIDKIRSFFFGEVADSETNRELDKQQMKVSWKSLYALTDVLLKVQASVILAATFRRTAWLQELYDITEQHNVSVSVVLCQAENSVIAARLKTRDPSSPSSLKSMDGYIRVKQDGFDEIPGALALDTGTLSLEECLQKILQII